MAPEEGAGARRGAGELSDTPLLDTDRLRLRPRVAADAAALFPTMSDPDAMRFWSRASFADVAELSEHFARDSPGWRTWAITHADDDTAIGFVAAGEKRQGRVTEVGYLLARKAWGHGIAAEAVAAVIDRLFVEGHRRVFADTDPENIASNRLLERLGFRREGLLRAEWETHIGVRDSVIWGLLKDDWRAAPSS